MRSAISLLLLIAALLFAVPAVAQVYTNSFEETPTTVCATDDGTPDATLDVTSSSPPATDVDCDSSTGVTHGSEAFDVSGITTAGKSEYLHIYDVFDMTSQDWLYIQFDLRLGGGNYHAAPRHLVHGTDGAASWTSTYPWLQQNNGALYGQGLQMWCSDNNSDTYDLTGTSWPRQFRIQVDWPKASGATMTWRIYEDKELIHQGTCTTEAANVVKGLVMGKQLGQVVYNQYDNLIVSYEPLPVNILLIILDDVGVNAIGAYEESDLDTTPQIDTLAEGGIMFRNAWTNPFCSATRASIYTGEHAFRHGVGYAFPTLRTSKLQIAQAMPNYKTYLAGKYHTNYSGPVGEGWDEAKFTAANLNDGAGTGYCDWYKTTIADDGSPAYSYDNLVCGTECDANEPDWAPTTTVNDVLGWITDDEEPWFITAAFHGIHDPLTPPPDYLHSVDAVKTQYTECTGAAMADDSAGPQAILEAMDTEIGRMLDEIDFSDTTVILVGDNGTRRMDTLTNSINRGKKGDNWEGGVNVPLLVKGKSVTDTVPAEAAALVHSIDLFPTILAIAGEDARPSDGISLMPVLADNTATVRSIVYNDAYFQPNQASPPYRDPSWHTVMVRNSQYKLIRYACALDGTPGGYALYDLNGDADESDDIYGTQPAVEAALKAEIEAVTGDDYDCQRNAHKLRNVNLFAVPEFDAWVP